MNEKKTILYVDDERVNLLLFKVNFQKKYNVITGSSGNEGLNQLHAYPETKIVISDMKMPGMNGLDFIKQAKEEFPDIIFFILTGFDITSEIEEALKTKLIKKYYTKPFNIGEIENSLSQAICMPK